MSYSLADLRSLVRQRADMESSTFIGAAELDNYINDAYEELFDLLVLSYGDYYFLSTATLTTTAGSIKTSVASLYKLLRVSVTLNGYSYPIRRFNFSDVVLDLTSRAWNTTTDIRYAVGPGGFFWQPIPNDIYSLEALFIKLPTRLSAPADALPADVQTWAEYIVVRAAKKCLDKQRSDASHLASDLAALTQRIRNAASGVDEMNPAHTADVQQDRALPWDWF